MEEQGVGLSVEEFEAKNRKGKLAGHIGFKESVAMIDAALKPGIDKVPPGKARSCHEVDRKSKYDGEGGEVAGADMRAKAYSGEKTHD